MKKIGYLIILSVIFSFVSCKQGKKELSEQEQLRQELNDFEKSLYETDIPDSEKAKEMIGKYVHFSEKYPSDSLTPEYLFKAAEVAMNFEQPNNAIKYLTKIETDYLEYVRYSGAIFLKAYVYENYLRDFEKAGEYYNKFITDYPDHNLAKDAEAALMFLGLNDEQLVELFEQMNKYPTE